MTEALPDPLVPVEVDLRDFQFTPIFRARLFGSSFHARSSDAEWRAGVTLWLKSWDQVPAGTLPDDDIDLCRLAEFGRDMKGWNKVKAGALHGWCKCTDGRLHHAVVAQGVLEAWGKRSSAKKRGSSGAEERWRKHREALAKPSKKDSSANAQAMLGDSKGQGIEGTGKGQGDGSEGKNPKVKPASAAPKTGAPDPGRTVPLWNAYSEAYRRRYSVDPTRNAKVNGMLAKFLERLPADEAPAVAAFYLTHNRGLYVSAKHPVDLLLRDAEGLRTEWATNRKVTDTEARQADQTQARGDVFSRLIAESEASP